MLTRTSSCRRSSHSVKEEGEEGQALGQNQHSTGRRLAQSCLIHIRVTAHDTSWNKAGGDFRKEANEEAVPTTQEGRAAVQCADST